MQPWRLMSRQRAAAAIRRTAHTAGEQQKLESGVFPSLHYRKEGLSASSRKSCVATEADADGVVFLWLCSENHPVLVAVEASLHFLDRSATPPCGGARRGIACL